MISECVASLGNLLIIECDDHCKVHVSPGYLNTRFAARSTSLALLGCVIASSAARGDAVTTAALTQFGRVVQMSAQGILLARACRESDTIRIQRADFRALVRDDRCEPHPVSMPVSSAVCASPVRRLHVQLTAPERNYQLVDAVFGGDTIVRMLLANRGGLTAALRRLRGIQVVVDCSGNDARDSADGGTLPNGGGELPGDDGCYDPPQFAVNWGPEPVADNRIFTRGFSFFLESDHTGSPVTDAPKAPPPDSVRLAFGTALTAWVSALDKIRDSLSGPLGAYVRGIRSCGGRFCMIAPPQVIAVRCRANALFVVRWVRMRNEYFPPGQESYVAKAQIEGRTVVMNGADHAYRSDLTMREITDTSGHVRLATVLAHELGHAFGLDHVDSTTSVMYYKLDASEPTVGDAWRFAAVLERRILGSAPGAFDLTACAGLQIGDWSRRPPR